MIEVMEIVAIYLVLGVVFETVIGRLIVSMEIERLTTSERIGSIVLWPMYLVIFLVMFIKGTRDGK